MNTITRIDGSHGEGGGQIIRNTTALSHIMSKPIHVVNVRSGRKNPGLQPQHLTSILTISQLNQSHVLQGAQKGSTEFKFIPAPFASLTKKLFEADTRTAGSCTLLMQALLPPLIFSKKLDEQPVEVILKGGTNVSHSPPIDEYIHVFIPLLRKHFGLNFDLLLERRGFYPIGKGILHLFVHHITLPIPAITMLDRGSFISSFKIYTYYTNESRSKLAQEMTDSVLQGLRNNTILNCRNVVPDIMSMEKDRTKPIGDVVMMTVIMETDNGNLYGASIITEDLKKKSKLTTDFTKNIISHLEKQWQEKGCVDEHVQDQLIIYCSLAKGVSKIRTGPLTDHTKTAIYFCSLITGAKFTIISDTNDSSVIIECEGIAYH